MSMQECRMRRHGRGLARYIFERAAHLWVDGRKHGLAPKDPAPSKPTYDLIFQSEFTCELLEFRYWRLDGTEARRLNTVSCR
jgi:hypothetical protein